MYNKIKITAQVAVSMVTEAITVMLDTVQTVSAWTVTHCFVLRALYLCTFSMPQL